MRQDDAQTSGAQPFFHQDTKAVALRLLSALRRPSQRQTSVKKYTVTTTTTTTTATPQKPVNLPSPQIPKDAWDSHMHVIDNRYPLAPDAAYRPNTFTVHDAQRFEAGVGIRNIVLVQPSIYGHDNSCMLDALQALGSHRARAVVAFDPETTSHEQLLAWHEMGVRGVRLNICSYGKQVEPGDIERLLRQYADAVRPLNWVVQVYIPMALISQLEPIVPTLNVRFCIDHLGQPDLDDATTCDPYQIPGFASLARLLQGGHVFVKLSAPYRLSRLDDQRDLEPVAKEVIRLGGKSRVVFATDWPHTRYEGLDIRPWIEKVIKWCGNDGVLVDRLFRGNAEDLWSVTRHV
ncbi:amidohydrolase [Emericellopsis atlantica]|uniref:Amidohydrolase n=1 Tax=Emericellopsis atlantica TaxID=2614577 RepID=A0A9P7ZUM1_9HYPO|nr:amidohydrolase [Emericellopsis atlantica]KAG9258172.1 amidohydrolase [Emericellopsis atlantica]